MGDYFAPRPQSRLARFVETATLPMSHLASLRIHQSPDPNSLSSAEVEDSRVASGRDDASICLLREMGGAPRNLAPRSHFLARIVKPSGCHCTDGHLTSTVFTEDQQISSSAEPP